MKKSIDGDKVLATAMESSKSNKHKSKRERRIYIFFILIGCLVALAIWVYWGNNAIEVTHLYIEDKLIPESFNGFTIVQISDLHNKEFGEGQHKLLKKIYDVKPDLIAVTGDIIDSRDADFKMALDLIEEAIRIAPVYYVTGNHEAWSKSYKDLEKQLRQIGVIILDDKMVRIIRGKETIQLIGLSDPDFTLKNDWFDERRAMLNKKLQDIAKADSAYKILLAHRPELVDVYAKNSINLVLSGHAHGGQFKIPFLGGVIAPDQGFFPKYTEGVYKIGGTKMIVSRGLGNSIIPIRINNRPELVVVTLYHSR